MAEANVPNDNVTLFAETNYRNQRRSFGIKLDDRRRHMYVIGKTGMGKTTMLENMIISDIRAGHGVAVVDPHGDLVEEIIDYIPPRRINDIVYFNPSDIDYPIAFNVLESVNPVHRHLVASGLLGVFKKIWADSWGPRLEYVLRNTILTLLEYPGSTLLGITRLLVDDKYRKKVLENLNDPILKAFWIDEYGAYSNQFRTEAISPIQNKVGQFLSSSIIRNIVGQTKSSIDMRDIMDSKKILLLNLSKGRIGEDNSALLGAMMITKLQLAAMSRVDIEEDERKDFFLYVDEFQNFATESFANILSEARKYRLNLIIAHQYIEQIDEIVRAAVFGNVGTLVSFRIGAADAEFLEKEFEPVFTMNDLVNLTKYEVYLKLMIDGMASEPFSAKGLPPLLGDKPEDNRGKVINISRERYANQRSVVEDKIMRWTGMHEDQQPEKNSQVSGTDKKNNRKPERRNNFSNNQKGRFSKNDSPRRPAPSYTNTKKEEVRVIEEKVTTQPAISLQEAVTREPVSFKNRRKPSQNRPDNRKENPRGPSGNTQKSIRPDEVVRF
ncbi:type IV secretion system DNA-binding domain-containing protein [Patescibacteria group bacterium]|nr:type IV secretion system DNA-binding domain-containing protein [Patescibacteria group bacterium]MBU1889925.1 type IV secretion system DNA-binding domain-containing protein [Patescibacteria group bacterium]